ncbi:hypothetical protein PMY37_07195 [Clostridium tertium]|uniref:hypothetical protein n=3 Tax=Clostridium TaxID=1485 RepID=UPI00232AAD93|nr:hypothetical protein [Clostridium tertium]MDB1944017.1 hypothetical protein [Clostridium tertium]
MSTISLGKSGIVGISYSETSLLKSNLMRANERRNSSSNNINSAKVKLQVNGRSGRIRIESDNLQSYYSSLKSNNSKIEKIIRDIDYIVRKFKEVDSRCASRVRAIGKDYKVQSFISKIGNSLISFGNKVFNGVSSFFKDGINIIKSIYNSASNSVGSAYRSVTDWFDRHQLAGNIISFGLNALAVIGAGVTLVAGGPVIVVVGAVLGGALALNSLLDDGTKIYNNISNGSNKGFNGLEVGLKSVAGEKVGGIIYGGLNVVDFALNIPHMFKGIGKLKTSLIDAGKAIKNFPSKVSGLIGTFKVKSIEAIKDASNILKVGYNNYINDTKNFSLGSNLGGEINKIGSNIKKAAEDIKNSKKIQSGIDVYDNLSDSKLVEGVRKPDFIGKLRGENVTLKDVKTKEISYIKRDTVELNALRNDFNTSARKNFLEELSKDVDYLKESGFSEKDILKINNGRVPDGWQVHHKLPLDDSGTNSFDNFVLIKNEPYHKVITNYQNSFSKQLEVGEIKNVNWPIPEGNIYPKRH